MKKRNIIESLKTKDELLTGTYVGAWCGDGTQYYDRGYRIKICCHSDNKKLITFFRFVLKNLFGKTISHVAVEKRNRSLLRFNSKFIYHFIFDYVEFDGNKTHTIHLKKEASCYSQDFLDGFLLGATLTDGYLKERFYFNVTSEKFAMHIFDILKLKGFDPRHYVHNRKKYGWKDLHTINLNKKQSKELKTILNLTIERLSYSVSFDELKYEKSGPAEI